MTENVLAFILAILWSISPASAFGAAVGAIILIKTIEDRYEDKKYTFGFISGFIGYFIAIPFMDTSYEFLIALLSSSTVLFIIIAFQEMINKNKGLPKWVTEMIIAIGDFTDIIRGRR